MNGSNTNIVGTCSICNGLVVQPRSVLECQPMVPTCSSCGATKRTENLPVIVMESSHPKPQLLNE